MTKAYRIKGSHRIFRIESDVKLEMVETERFEPSEKNLDETTKVSYSAPLVHTVSNN